jgi:hypothetical protein
MTLRTDRSWDMQVWELDGAPATWRAQLDKLQQDHPVFAVASGLGAGNWAPVHAFCEARRVPCWFPSVGAVPAESERSFYSLYFSRGVALEADVLARHIEAGLSGARASTKQSQLLQVFADDGVMDTAVAAMKSQLAGLPVRVSDFRLGANTAALSARLASLGKTDRVVFWLTPGALKTLQSLPPPKAQVYFSAGLGGGDRMPLVGAWREAAQVIYPYQLPELRQRGLIVFKDFLRVRKLAVDDEVLQSEVYFALSYLNDTLVDMLDNVHRDYLLERGENMLSLREAAKAEDEARDLSLPKMNLVSKNVQPLRPMSQRMIIPRAPVRSARAASAGIESAPPQGQGMLAMPSAPAAEVAQEAKAGTPAPEPSTSKASDAPTSTTVYPRLSLGQFQRHASKGAYVVRLDATGSGPLRADSGWIIP